MRATHLAPNSAATGWPSSSRPEPREVAAAITGRPAASHGVTLVG